MGTYRKDIPAEIIVIFPEMPHLEEQDGQTFHRTALHLYGIVLPVPETFLPVEVLIGEIHAARKAGPAVYDHDLPVIPVILIGREQRNDLGEDPARNTVGLQPVRIRERQQAERAGTVVHHAHFHAFPGLSSQDIKNGFQHLPAVHDEEFHEDERFRLFQFRQKRRKEIVAQRIICQLRIRIRGISAEGIHIFRQAGAQRLIGNDLLFHSRILYEIFLRKQYVLPEAFLDPAAPGLALDKK